MLDPPAPKYYERAMLEPPAPKCYERGYRAMLEDTSTLVYESG